MDIENKSPEKPEQNKVAKKDMLNKPLFAILLVLIIVYYFANWYLDKSTGPVMFSDDRFIEIGSPCPQLTYLSAKIYKYAEDHEGSLPVQLNELFPAYIDVRPSILGQEEMFHYAKDPENGFILNVEKPERWLFAKMRFTGKTGLLDVGYTTITLPFEEDRLQQRWPLVGTEKFPGASQRPSSIAPVAPQIDLTPPPKPLQGPGEVKIVPQSGAPK